MNAYEGGATDAVLRAAVDNPDLDLARVIEDAVPGDIPSWRFRYSEQVAAAVRRAGWTRTP